MLGPHVKMPLVVVVLSWFSVPTAKVVYVFCIEYILDKMDKYY